MPAEKSPKACLYAALSNAISVAKCANIQIIDSILKQYKCIHFYFNTSPKREKYLEYSVQLRCQDKYKKKKP